MNVAGDKLVMGDAGSRSHGSEHLKKALVYQKLVKDARLLGEVWSSIRDCGVRLSEDQSELKLSLESPVKVTRALNLSSFQGSLVIRKCYQDLWDIIERRVVMEKEMNFLVLGSPGVGKSYFLLYMLIHLSTKANTAVFMNTLRGRKCVVFPGTGEAFENGNIL